VATVAQSRLYSTVSQVVHWRWFPRRGTGYVSFHHPNISQLTYLLKDGREVTRNLHINYFRPIPVSEKILVECEIVNAGQRLATVRGLMKKESDGALLASCLHDKFNPVAGGGSKL
jgi:hypothetical protein